MIKKVFIILGLALALTAILTSSVRAEGEGRYFSSSNATILEQALEDAGYNETSTLAILGNIAVKTCGRFDPTILNGDCNSTSSLDGFPVSGSIGLAQWTSTRKDNLKAFAEAEGASPLDMGTQTRFLLKELNDNGFTPSNMNSYPLEQSTYIIFRRFLTGSSDAPLTFMAYAKYPNDSTFAAVTVNYASALSVATNKSLAALANGGAGNQYGPSCNPILPSNANAVYGLKSTDIKNHVDIGVIRACMNKFVSTSFSTTNNTYDQELANAVTKFQKNKGIWSSSVGGRVGKTTRCAICKTLYPAATAPASYNNYCARASNCGTSQAPTSPTVPTIPTDGAVGVQSTSGYYNQGDYSNVYWKYKKGTKKRTKANKSSISTSGCSFIATVNAAKRVGVSLDIKTLADWTIERSKQNPPAESGNSDGVWTEGGWDKIKGIINNYSKLSGKVGYRTLSLAGSADNKLSQVKSELKKGNAIIFFGKGGAPYTSGGHYVTVIGVTSDNKIVVTNVASGSSTVAYKTFFSRSYSTPIVVYKK